MVALWCLPATFTPVVEGGARYLRVIHFGITTHSILCAFFYSIAREELVKLQRDYRRSEGSRKTLTESSQNDIRKQQYDIHTT